MTHTMDWLIKFLVILMVAPFVLCMIGAVAAAILPWLLLCSVIAGLVAGIAAAIMLRRRLPPRGGQGPLPPAGPPLGGYRVRRPGGGQTWRR